MSVPGNGRVAGGIVDALKTQPMLLAMLITNITLLVFVFYMERQHAARSDKVGTMVQSMFERCLKP